MNLEIATIMIRSWIYSFLKIRRKRMEEVKEEIKAFGIAQSGHQEAQLNFHYILIVTIKGEGNSPPQNNEENHSI